MERLSTLEGAEFEIEFMEMMIKHHEGAIREGKICLQRAHHQDLADLCQAIIETQTSEIEQLESWLCQWNQRC
jgi:uncharacterized protein (DUF305 family)